MKIFTKIFLCCILVFSAAYQISGYLLINFSYENAISQEKKYALNQYQYNKFIVQADWYAKPELFTDRGMKKEGLKSIVNDMNAQAAVYNSDQEVIYSELPYEPGVNMLKNATDTTVTYQIIKKDNKSFILTCGRIEEDDIRIYLITATDISAVVENQGLMTLRFQKLYLLILLLSLVLIFILSFLLSRPIKKVSQAAKRIAAGSYSERIQVSGKDEIGDLADNFNQMAEAIEEKIEALSNQARQKEDFAANFAHELKTPLTSVIGYADMIYQKELTREQVKEAAGYILNEGMRLEALSLKLMDLIILHKQEFVLENIAAEEAFHNIALGIEPICREKNVTFHMNVESARVKLEFDLFKTLLLNLIDNAIKAESKDIWLTGKKQETGYRISVEDNGRGIPKEELGRITEAFYMVDKSRSRKQHGAGLGLALAEGIANIHSTSLKILSDGASGTTVSMELCCQEGFEDE